MGSRVGHILIQSVASLSDLFFPRICVVCGSHLEAGKRYLCPECEDDIPLTYFWSWEANPAEARLQALFPAQRACSLFIYRNDSGYSHLIHNFKYKADINLGKKLASLLAEYMISGGRFEDIEAVVSVPLHPIKKWQRGFNQSDIIGRQLASVFQQYYGHTIIFEPNLVRRKRYTRSQTKAADRTANMAGAFQLDKNAIRRFNILGIKKILLVDDVLTTGSTIASIASVIGDSIDISVATLGFVE
ncbi:MAG: ComF family protein [Bacteroidales bacterium]|nr:ComF family protein [Bacteroidales bacterium]